MAGGGENVGWRETGDGSCRWVPLRHGEMGTVGDFPLGDAEEVGEGVQGNCEEDRMTSWDRRRIAGVGAAFRI